MPTSLPVAIENDAAPGFWGIAANPFVVCGSVEAGYCTSGTGSVKERSPARCCPEKLHGEGNDVADRRATDLPADRL